MNITATHLAHDLQHVAPLISCRFSSDGKSVFAGSEDYQVWKFNFDANGEGDANKPIGYDTDAWVRAMAVLPNRRELITGGYDGRLIWWPETDAAPKPIRTVQAHDGWIRALALSSDRKLLASVGNDLVVRVWNAETGERLKELRGHESYIYNVAFHPADANRLVTGDLMANLIDWEWEAGKQVRTWRAESLQKYDKTFVADIGGFRGMTFSADATALLCSGITNVSNAFAGVGNPSVVAFDWETNQQQIEHLSKGKVQGVAWGVACLNDGTRVAATGGRGGYLLFWKPEEANEFHNVKMKDVGRDLDLSRDGLHLAVPHHNKHLSIFLMDAKK
ncbi:MAG: hypothetical protein Fues2KO_11850 [Fuerstiella sp.]